MKNEGYFTVQSWMVTELKLRTVERDMFAIIYGMSQDGKGSFYSTVEWASDITGYSKNSICTALKSLTEKGLITKKSKPKSSTFEYQANLEAIQTTWKPGIQTTCIESTEGIQTTWTINKNNNTNKLVLFDNKKENKNNKSQEILDMYHNICVSFPKVRSLTDKRNKTIQSLIKKGYTTGVFEEAFMLAEQSDFLKGNNDRGWKANFDFFLREDKLIAILEGKYGGHKKSRDGLGGTTDSHERKAAMKRRIADGTLKRI